MSKIENTVRLMPDVAGHAQPHLDGLIDWVGMADVQVPVSFDAGDGVPQRSSARVGAFVNLRRADKRGIHMSRLYLLVDHALSSQALTVPALQQLLKAFLESHGDLSDQARITIRFDQLVRRQALRSQNSGWRAYPVQIEASLTAGEFRCELATEVVYSSTCPASAALARQLIQEQFVKDFSSAATLDYQTVHHWLGSEQGILATPHAQRSVAHVRVQLDEGASLQLIDLLDRVEQALGTPVQTAVKREDEQAFALANGSNLMFCEDAARRIQQALNAERSYRDFHIRVEHQESLHPHDAVAYASKP